MLQEVSETKEIKEVREVREVKYSFEKRLREIQKLLQFDHTSKELKKRTAYISPSEKRVIKKAQRNAVIIKAQRKTKSKSSKGNKFALPNIFGNYGI